MPNRRSLLPLLLILLTPAAGCGDDDPAPPACPAAPDTSGGKVGDVGTFADVGGKSEGLVFDGAGSLYVTLTRQGKLVKVDAAGKVTQLTSGLSAPSGVALDAAGDLWVCEYGDAKGGGEKSKKG